MSNITVSYGEIEQAATRLGQEHEDITGRLQALQLQIQQLVSSGFVTDQASVRFHEVFEEYSAGARTVIERLGEMQGFLLGTATALRDMDAQIAARIG